MTDDTDQDRTDHAEALESIPPRDGANDDSADGSVRADGGSVGVESPFEVVSSVEETRVDKLRKIYDSYIRAPFFIVWTDWRARIGFTIVFTYLFMGIVGPYIIEPTEVGEAGALGLPTAYGMGLGLFACRDDFLRQVPGRLVGAGEDAAGDRAFTLTLQTREQHIRKERATSNICTNQAWVALRAAIHAATLGPDGLVDLANDCVTEAAALADRIDGVKGATAPVHDRHHVREFVVRVDQPAAAIAGDLEAEGFAVHAIGEHLLQVCVTDLNAGRTDGLVAAFEEVI